MKKRIVICADGTWNRPEQNLKKDVPTNVLKLARAVSPAGQQVFYDWGVGSSHDAIAGGLTGRGLHKNIMDDYRYLVQNYAPGDEIFLFGFSRGAYTIRSLCGMINNCGILKRPDARLIQSAFDLYKTAGEKYKPDGAQAVRFRQAHAHRSRRIRFVGVWDTVGAMGIPVSFVGLFKDRDEFYDTKLGRNVQMARHALAIDEHREDFEPTIWQRRSRMDIRQVWFSGSHSDVGGGYRPARDGTAASDYTLRWMASQAAAAGLVIERHLLQSVRFRPTTRVHRSRVKFFKLRGRHLRALDHGQGDVLLHPSVRQRWLNDPRYRPPNLREHVSEHGWTLESD